MTPFQAVSRYGAITIIALSAVVLSINAGLHLARDLWLSGIVQAVAGAVLGALASLIATTKDTP